MEVQGVLLPTAFPPTLSAGGTEDALAHGLGVAELRLRNWSDALLELLNSVRRGPAPEAQPVEEVWHWLASHEQLTRSLSFVDHDVANELLCRVAEAPSEEAEENTRRWRAAVQQLRLLQKEAKWNADYLRVVEEPLRQLSSSESLISGTLSRTVKLLLRSLNRIYIASNFFKEQRMAALLHKVLKVLIGQAGHGLVSPLEVAKPRRGFATSLEAAAELRDSFQNFIDGYFIKETDGGSSSSSSCGRRPATAMGSQADRTAHSFSALKRSTTGDLGWWRATVRTSLEHAEHCRAVCHRLGPLLEGCRLLAAARSTLRSADGTLLREVDSFFELHSGLREFPGGTPGLLDLKNRAEALVTIQGTEEKLQALLKRAAAAGLDLDTLAEAADSDEYHEEGANGAPAEVLVIDHPDASPSVVGAGLQGEADAISESLRRFGSEIDSISAAISRNSSAGRTARFAPPSRIGSPPAVAEQAEFTFAAEVARRSSWYREPPSLLPSGVEIIEVRQDIQIRDIDNCDRRPRTAQPALFATRAPIPEDPGEGASEPESSSALAAAPDAAADEASDSEQSHSLRSSDGDCVASAPAANVEADGDGEVVTPLAAPELDDGPDGGLDHDPWLEGTTSSPCGSTLVGWRVS